MLHLCMCPIRANLLWWTCSFKCVSSKHQFRFESHSEQEQKGQLSLVTSEWPFCHTLVFCEKCRHFLYLNVPSPTNGSVWETKRKQLKCPFIHYVWQLSSSHGQLRIKNLDRLSSPWKMSSKHLMLSVCTRKMHKQTSNAQLFTQTKLCVWRFVIIPINVH